MVTHDHNYSIMDLSQPLQEKKILIMWEDFSDCILYTETFYEFLPFKL